MTTPHDTALEAALFALLREKSAQCGEHFDTDMFVTLKTDDPEAYDEELVQMRCAITAYLAALPVDEEAFKLISQIKAALTNLVEKRNNDLFSHHFCAKGAKAKLDTLKTYLRTPQPPITELLDERQPAGKEGNAQYWKTRHALLKAKTDKQPSLTEPQPMSEGERAGLFARMQGVYDDEAAQCTGLHKHHPQCLMAALAHIEANYHLVKKDK